VKPCAACGTQETALVRTDHKGLQPFCGPCRARVARRVDRQYPELPIVGARVAATRAAYTAEDFCAHERAERRAGNRFVEPEGK
jgi:hypothetical protein